MELRINRVRINRARPVLISQMLFLVKSSLNLWNEIFFPNLSWILGVECAERAPVAAVPRRGGL